MKNFKGYDGKIYCFPHTPKPAATTVTDSVAMKTALAAPKKQAEGLGNVQKGIGGKPSIAVFGMKAFIYIHPPVLPTLTYFIVKVVVREVQREVQKKLQQLHPVSTPSQIRRRKKSLQRQLKPMMVRSHNTRKISRQLHLLY